jgi:hypothetical protein
MGQVHVIGRHVTYFEEPDIIFLRLSGPVSEEEGREINLRNREAGARLRHVFFLIDLGELLSLPSSVRRMAAETLRLLPTRAVVVYRAPLRARVIATMVVAALNFYRPEGDRNLLEYFDTEEEARAWLAQVRRRVLSAA